MLNIKKNHVKRYSKKLLESNYKAFEIRSKALEKLGGKFKCIKKHNFYIKNDHIELETEFVDKKHYSAGIHLIEPLMVLADELNQVNASIPHGDIVKKNVLWDGSNFILVDWEPLLEYGAESNLFFKSTKPYISRCDVKNSKITSNTDKIAFFYFCRKQLHGWFPTEISEPIKLENDLISLEFNQIPKIALSFTPNIRTNASLVSPPLLNRLIRIAYA